MFREILIVGLIAGIIGCGIIEWQLSDQVTHLQDTADQLKQIDTHYQVHSDIQVLIINGTTWFYGMDGNTVVYQSTNATWLIEQMMLRSENFP